MLIVGDLLPMPMSNLVDLSIKVAALPVIVGFLAMVLLKFNNLGTLTLMVVFWSLIVTPWLVIDRLGEFKSYVKDAGFYLENLEEQGIVIAMAFGICVLCWLVLATLRLIVMSRVRKVTARGSLDS